MRYSKAYDEYTREPRTTAHEPRSRACGPLLGVHAHGLLC